MIDMIKKFVDYLFTKVYCENNDYTKEQLKNALDKCILDVRYHFPSISDDEILKRITNNKNELPLFLYRFASEIYKDSQDNQILDSIHWIMRECCCCEIYFSNKIDTGFYIVHGVGTIIGSRNTIGKGFTIYQGCTIGHKEKLENGCIIGDNVSIFENSSIIGKVKIGNNVIIGARSLVMTDIFDNNICYGNPLKYKKKI